MPAKSTAGPPPSLSPKLSPTSLCPLCCVYNAPLSPPHPPTCLNVSQTLSTRQPHILWASSSFSNHSSASIHLSSAFSPLLRLSRLQILTPTQATNLSSICAPPTSDLLVSGYFFFPNASTSHANFRPLHPSFIPSSSLPSPPLSHPTPRFSAFFLFADSVAQSILPDSPVWGACLVPLNAAWETRSPASFRCHYWNTTRSDRQTRTHTHTPTQTLTHLHSSAPSTFLHTHKSLHISQHTHTHTHRDLVTEEATRTQFTLFLYWQEKLTLHGPQMQFALRQEM